MASILEIEGIGPILATRLKEVGMYSTTALRRRGGSPNGRKMPAAEQVAEWVDLAKALPRVIEYLSDPNQIKRRPV